MSEISEKRSACGARGVTQIALTDEAGKLLRLVAGPAIGDSAKAAIRRAERKLPQWKASRIRTLWYADPRARVRAEEIEQLRAMVQPRARVDLGDGDMAAVLARLRVVEERLAAIDPEFHTADLAALRSVRP